MSGRVLQEGQQAAPRQHQQACHMCCQQQHHVRMWAATRGQEHHGAGPPEAEVERRASRGVLCEVASTHTGGQTAPESTRARRSTTASSS